MTQNIFDARNIANTIGLSTDHYDWPHWIDEIQDNQLDLIRGKLTMRFGRLNSDILPRNTRDHIREHIRSLELQLSHWLGSTEALIDHLIIAKGRANDERWWWTEKHVDYWKIRGKIYNPLPINIQLIPLCGYDSLSEFENRFYAPIREIFCTRVDTMLLSERESLLDSIESVCDFMGTAEIDECPDLSSLLRLQRVNQLFAQFGADPSCSQFKELRINIKKMPSEEFMRLRSGIEQNIMQAIQVSVPLVEKNQIGEVTYNPDSSYFRLNDWWREQD